MSKPLTVAQSLSHKKGTMIAKRCFDFICSTLGIIILSPLLAIIAISIKVSSKGEVIFKQVRVGKDGKKFHIYKFRTMIKDAEKVGLQLSTSNDSRITKVGKILRKTKLDELAQLFNVFIGNMSFVGPRPEVPRYVELYDDYSKQVLLVKPGITDLSSIEYRNENEILEASDDRESTYINKVMPAKIDLSIKYIEHMSFFYDIGVIFRTIYTVLFK